MMRFRQMLIGAAVAAIVSLAGFGADNRSLADDLMWQTQRGARPAVYQEPLGGRIDDAPNTSHVIPASATDESNQASQRIATTAAEGNPAPRRVVRQTAPPQGQRAAPTRAMPWQTPPGVRKASYVSEPRPNAPWQHQPAGTQGPAPRTSAQFVASRPMPAMSPEPEIVSSGMPIEGEEIVEGFDGGFGDDGFGDGGCCNDGGCPGFCGRCPQCPPGCIPAPRGPTNFDIFGGVEGFKGPLDQGRNGNFGAHEGFNIGGPVWLTNNIGYQFGAEWVQSNFSGDQSTGQFRDDYRTQTFSTVGLFSRANSCWPWQAGVALDWLNDDYVVNYNVTQLRAELSRVFCNRTEIGFTGAFHMLQDHKTFDNEDEESPFLEGDFTLRTVDQYCLFIRRRFENCGEGRIWGGATADGDGLVGADFRVPISDSFLIQGNFNYLIPRDGGEAGQQEEAWGIGIELVFTPFCSARRGMSDAYRPLFNVADNSRMFVEPK